MIIAELKQGILTYQYEIIVYRIKGIANTWSKNLGSKPYWEAVIMHVKSVE